MIGQSTIFLRIRLIKNKDWLYITYFFFFGLILGGEMVQCYHVHHGVQYFFFFFFGWKNSPTSTLHTFSLNSFLIYFVLSRINSAINLWVIRYLLHFNRENVFKMIFAKVFLPQWSNQKQVWSVFWDGNTAFDYFLGSHLFFFLFTQFFHSLLNSEII